MNTPHVDVKGIVKVKVKGIVKVDIKRNPLMWSRRQDIKNFLLITFFKNIITFLTYVTQNVLKDIFLGSYLTK